MTDKRACKRVRVNMKAAFRDNGHALRRGRVLNLSRCGMYLETGHGVLLDGFVTVSLDAEEFGKVIHVHGVVVRKSPTGFGVAFVRADDRGLANVLAYLGAPF
ncbi:MAG TPA: PilZ domain-containing protein [Deltaproteobacteria bacterium]|nr:PilZ domain-containing protein [Deltaproteobacteria bacterium]